MRKVVVVVAVLAVLGALGGGLYLVGPPADARARRVDAHRENDLQRLRLAADLYWSRHGRLPASLDELDLEAGTRIYSRDPETGEPPYTPKAATPTSCAQRLRESPTREGVLVARWETVLHITARDSRR
jgi:hypothetical protein